MRTLAEDAARDVLGELHLAAVTVQWFTTLTSNFDPSTAFAAGRPEQLTTAEGLQHRHVWETAYQHAAKRPNRSWFAK